MFLLLQGGIFRGGIKVKNGSTFIKSEPKSLLPKQHLSRKDAEKLPSRWDTQLDTKFSDLSLLPMFEGGLEEMKRINPKLQVDLPKDQARLRLFPERTTLSERYMLDNT